MCAPVMEGKRVYLEKVTVRGDRSGTPEHLLRLAPWSPSTASIMEAAINNIIAQFKVYAGNDASSNTLSKDEFHKLVTSQLSNFVKNASDPGVIDQLMSSIDENNDGELTFSEFWQLIGKLASKQGGFSQ
ncbi:protein S100-A11 [Kryptolebias marmoratus]|uniref:Protein S100-A11-like n=1 Tax=Kryptolebias marmoratus TaxID=37003 RepID=A0A3Q3AUF3_KRYMA|nr:protein S100-A11 [Kryptolebias marmoratus]